MTQSEWNKLLSNRISADTSSEVADSINENLLQIKSEKVANAANRKMKKINNYFPTDYTGLQQKYGNFRQTSGAHDFNNQQEEFGRLLAEERVYDGDYLLKYNPNAPLDPNQQYKMKGSEYIPFDGETRDAYIRNLGVDPKTGDQLQKFGLARNDLTEEAIKKGITPEKARYMDKTRGPIDKLFGLNKVYKGEGGEYDGTPGKLGESVGEALFEGTFDKDAITEFELKRYMDRSTIGARAMGLGPTEDTNYDEFGSGGSEYTLDSKDPLFNINASKFQGELPEGTQTPVVPRAYNERGERLSDLENFIQKNAKPKKSNDSSVGNALSGFGYTFGEGVINTLDLVPEVAEYAYKNIAGEGQTWSKTEGLYNEENSETFKEWIGYNEKVMNNLSKKAIDSVKKSWNEGDYWSLLDTIWEGVKTPELAATSLGYVAGLVLPGTAAKKAVDVVSGVNKLAKSIKAADSTGKLTKAQALQIAAKEAGPGYKIANIVAGNVGYAGGAEQFARDAEELYKETYNEEMPTDQKMLSRVGGLLFTKMDAGIAKALILGKDPVAKAIPQMIKSLPNAMKASLLGKIALMSGTTSARVTGAFGLEALTEGVQTSMEKVAGLYKEDEKSIRDVLEEGKFDIAAGALLGGAGGAQMTAPSTAKDAVELIDPKSLTEKARKGIEKATETPLQKKQRENREFSAPLQEEATMAVMNGSPDEVVNKVNKIHGKLDNLDESANKKATYGIVIKNSLDRAIKSGDKNAIDGVYKTIAELDKGDNDFQAKDLVDEMTYSATQEFLNIINRNIDTSDAKIQELRKDSTDEIMSKSVKRDNILKEVQELEVLLESEERRLKSIKGSNDFKKSIDELTELKSTIKDYIKGKDVATVNNEFAELGFIVSEGDNDLVADPNRPGLKVYEKELQDKLLNPKVNKNLLNEKVNKGAKVKLTGLTNFAESRLKKLQSTSKKEAFQSKSLIYKLHKENEQMVNTIKNILTTARGLKELDETTKKSYEKELETAAKFALEANKELTKRKDILNSINEKGTYVFNVDTDGKESIQEVTTKDSNGKFQKVKYADVINGKAIPIETEVKKDETKEEYMKISEDIIKEIKELKEKGKTKDQIKAQFDADSRKTPELRSKINRYIENYYGKEPASEESSYKTAKETESKTRSVKTNKTPSKSPLSEVRIRIAYINEELSNLIADVPDMEVKKHVKDHYTKKLKELQKDRTKLSKLIDRLEKVIDKRVDRKYGSKDKKLMSAIIGQIDKLIKKMLKQLNKLGKMLKKVNKKYSRTATELQIILDEINAVEKDFTSSPVKTTAGKVTTIDEKLYNKPVLEVDDKRTTVEKRIIKKGSRTGKEVAQSTAINDALEVVKKDKMAELRDELKAFPKGETSLGAKLVGRLLLNFPMNSSVHKIIKRGNDSVFGKLTGNLFADTNRLLEVLPKNFKEFFANDKESREVLIENIQTMATYLNNTKISPIKIGDKRLGKYIDNKGLAMFNREKNGKMFNFPVEVLELIGTVKNNELQIDEQTKNILKFYTAKMLGDSQTIIGKILSFDESEMSQYLGITDPEEQLNVKREASQGYVNSASIRKDIGSEVYQALGIRFNQITPEFTEESFKSALGVLVQAIAIDNGSMISKTGKFGGKNQLLVKSSFDNIGVEKENLIRSINKLQYMNENRSRPLPDLKRPIDDNNRIIMNTHNQMDKKSIDFLNKQEKIAYTISPRLKRWLEIDEDDALKSMGYVDVETSDLHVSEVDAQIARNDKLIREWDILKTFAKATKNKKFYLKWGQTVSGRYTILNDIQYQESKLHREFIVAEGSTVEVDVNKQDDVEMLRASVLQGLDMDPDKLSSNTVTKTFNKLFKVTNSGIKVEPVKDKNGNLNSTHVAIKKAYELLRDENKIDPNATAEVFANSEGHHGVSSIELLVNWDSAIKGNGKFKTHANLEIDAITSGMILTLLQIGSNQAIKLAEKGGIYTSKRKEDLEKYVQEWLGKDVEFSPGALIEAGKKHASAIEDPNNPANTDAVKILNETNATKNLNSDEVFKDLYSTIGVAMLGEVQAHKTMLKNKDELDNSEVQQLAILNQIGDLNLSNIRSIAKSPVMVYIYGATINSIKKKLTYSLGVDTLVKAIEKSSNLVKNSKDATKELKFISKFIPEDKEKYVDRFGMKIKKPKERWEQLLYLDITDAIEPIDSAIRATFGTGIETAFSEKLGFIDKNRDAAKSIEMLVFQAYQVRMTEEVNKMLDEKYGPKKHKGESYKLSKEDMQNINNRLTEQGFGHNIVWDEESGRVNQSLNKTGTKGSQYSTNATVGDTKVGGQIKQFKPMVNTGAAPTISIHAIDGRIMLNILNRELNRKYAGGNVYDAVILSLDKSMLTDTADVGNTTVIETGFSRSVVADQLSMLENMLSTMSDKQKVEMFNSIGLRPKGELKEDYIKETNRLKLSTGKMLERIESAEEVNKERLINSSKGYYSGHLFQTGSGLVEVSTDGIRAKNFPVIESVKKLLKNKMVQDRKVTQKEFSDEGIKLDSKTDYVFNLNDIKNRKTQVESEANIAQMKPYTETNNQGNIRFKIKVTDKLWDSLSSNDTVEIVGEYEADKKNSQTYWYNEILKKLNESDATVIDNRVKKPEVATEELSKVTSQKLSETKQQEGIIDSIKYVQDALQGVLNEKSRNKVSKITDKKVLDELIKNIKCRKGI